MFVSGLSFAGVPMRPVASSAVEAASSPAEHDDAQPAYFRSISAISPGSLASAYQAIRAHETAVVPVIPGGEPAILSGLGIPGALAAYGETMKAD